MTLCLVQFALSWICYGADFDDLLTLSGRNSKFDASADCYSQQIGGWMRAKGQQRN